MRHFNSLAYLVLILAGPMVAQNTDSLAIVSWLNRLQNEADKPLPELLVQAGRLQLGIPYKAGLLEVPGPERLIITATKGADCVLFIENALATARAVKEGKADFTGFSRQLMQLRYLNGTVDGYTSRKHYFTEWMLELADSKNLTFLTSQASVPLQHIHFMSSNPAAYAGLTTDASLRAIKKSEFRINAAALTYTPSIAVEQLIPLLQDGDILAFVTSVKGLDVSHTAIFTRTPEQATFLHASTKGSVLVEPLGLAGYLKTRKSVIGVIAGRLR